MASAELCRGLSFQLERKLFDRAWGSVAAGDVDATSDRESFVYVALDDEVAARFQIARRFEVASGEAVARLKAEGRKLYLASLDRRGQRLS